MFASMQDDNQNRMSLSLDKSWLSVDENLEKSIPLSTQQMLQSRYSANQTAALEINQKMLFQSKFNHKKKQQDRVVQKVLGFAEETVKNTQKANKELKKAQDYSEKYGIYWAIFFFALASVMLLYDTLKG